MDAKAIYYSICGGLAVAGTFIAKTLGGWDTALQTLIALMVADYVTGLLIAFIWKKSGKTENGTFESNASVKGLFRKMSYLVCIYIATRLDILTGADVCRTVAIMFFIANDGFSLLENFGIMGVPYPKAMKDAFEALKEKSE